MIFDSLTAFLLASETENPCSENPFNSSVFLLVKMICAGLTNLECVNPFAIEKPIFPPPRMAMFLFSMIIPFMMTLFLLKFL